MKNRIIFLVACAIILFAFGANAQEEEKEAEKKDPCATVSCSYHGNCVVAPSGFPMCACDNGYTPDTVNGLSCQPVNQAATQPAAQPQPVAQPVYQPIYMPPVYQPVVNPLDNPNSSEYHPYNTMTQEQIRRIFRRNKVKVAFLAITEAIGIGGIVGGILLVLGDEILGGALIITLSAILVSGCSSGLGLIGAQQKKIVKYLQLRGYANLQNPYLAIRDETITQFAF